MILEGYSSARVLGGREAIVKFCFDGGVILGGHRGAGILEGREAIVKFCFDGGVDLGGHRGTGVLGVRGLLSTSALMVGGLLLSTGVGCFL